MMFYIFQLAFSFSIIGFTNSNGLLLCNGRLARRMSSKNFDTILGVENELFSLFLDHINGGLGLVG